MQLDTNLRSTSGPNKRRGIRWWVAILGLAALGSIWWGDRDAKEAPPPAAPSVHTNPSTTPPSRGALPSKTRTARQAGTKIAFRQFSPEPVPVSDAPRRDSSPESTGPFPRLVQNALEAQLALARLGISPGSIDGVFGSRTRSALMAFQQTHGLPLTGELDEVTKGKLLLTDVPYTNYLVTAEDVARLRPLGRTWLEKSQQDRLDYESILELVAETGKSSPTLIRRLNPEINWTNITAGTVVQIPNVGQPPAREKAAFARIHLESRTLDAFDENTDLVAHFPCSIAAFAEKRPVGELRVAVIANDPNYTFDPENFPESPEARQADRKLILQPGPNNPVGTVWIGLDKPGYGIHGTPRPEQVGRAESHGCFRLANWNAEHFLKLVWVGMPVWVEP